LVSGVRQTPDIDLDTPAWIAWLHDPLNLSFRFQSPLGAFTARKEHRKRGGSYWSAYRRQAGKLTKHYLGKVAGLNLEQLESAAQILSSNGQKSQTQATRQPVSASPDQNVKQKSFAQRNRGIPRSPKLELVRTTLLERLLTATDTSLVVIVAPAGYGKTTLLTQFAHQAPRPVAWLTLTEDAADPTVLHREVVQTIHQVMPELKLLEDESLSSLSASPAKLAWELTRKLDLASQNLSLILDQTERLGTDAMRWIQTFIENVAEGHQLVLSGYELPKLPLEQYAAQGTVFFLGVEDLAFNVEETTQYLTLARNTLEPETIQQQLEGWAAGIALVVHGASMKLEPKGMVLSVLDKLPTRLRSNLCQAAVAEVWSAEKLEQLGVIFTKDWLRQVQRVGLPMTMLKTGVYRPHGLVLEVLEEELKTRPEVYKQLHLAAAREAEVIGDVLLVLKHLGLVGEYTQMSLIATKAARQYLDKGKFQLLCQIVESVPIEHRTLDLEAILGRTWIETGQINRGEELVQRLWSKNHHMNAFFSLCIVLFRRGNTKEVLSLIEEGERLVQQDTLENQMVFKRVRAIGFMYVGQYQAAKADFLKVLAWSEQNNRSPDIVTTVLQLNHCHVYLGEMHEAERTLERGLSIIDTEKLGGRRFICLNALADLYRITGRFDEALNLIKEALTPARIENDVVEVALLQTRGEIYEMRADFINATENFRSALVRAIAHKADTMAFLPRLQLSHGLRRIGQTQEAQTLLEQAIRLPIAEVPEMKVFLNLHHGIAAFLNKQFKYAQQFLDAIDPSASEPSDLARTLAYKAEVARVQGRLTKPKVAALIAQLDVLGSDAVLRIDAEPLAGLYLECQRRSWWAERFVPFTTALPIQNTSNQRVLKLTTLGTLTAFINNTQVKLPFAKAGELLIWLALNGAASREQIFDALWDGSTESRHLEYFKVAVRRLRYALAEASGEMWNPLPFEQGRYRLDERFEIVLDASILLKAPEHQEINALRQTLEMNQGLFLHKVNTEWVEILRERLIEVTLEGQLRCAELLEIEQPLEALKFYQAALNADPLSEDAYQGVMRLLDAIGDQKAIRRFEVSHKAHIARILN
jgi:LuxR family transcriptional regulator, maltose regulon positive regulatory protein